MQNVQNLSDCIQLAADIAMRQCVTPERMQGITALAMRARFEVVWRTNAHSSAAAKKLWALLEGTTDMEVLMLMTSEHVARAGVDISRYQEMVEALARSLSWSKGATAVSNEIQQFTGSEDDYYQTFYKNGWLVFLYLLSMSDIIQQIEAKTKKKTLPQE